MRDLIAEIIASWVLPGIVVLFIFGGIVGLVYLGLEHLPEYERPWVGIREVEIVQKEKFVQGLGGTTCIVTGRDGYLYYVTWADYARIELGKWYRLKCRVTGQQCYWVLELRGTNE